ncbi:TIM barrel protein [Nesterenkonia sp. PF2B19]|uniref:TIM barrel protein n=1 Tax=Nesterenkonia sp. K-15-9-6 TaxID=3093918 RepID=UPI0008729FA2
MTSAFAHRTPTSYVLNCSTLLSELPVLERAAAAAAHGFADVEFWWPFDGQPAPSPEEVDGFVASLDEAGVSLTGLNFWAGNMAGGDRGMVSVIGRQDEFRRNVEITAEIGRRTGCRAFNALYGLRQDGQDAEAQDALAVENLVHAARAVETIGGIVLVEPVSGAEGYPLKTAADALAVVERVHAAGAANVALLADFYHLAVNGDDVAAVIEAHAASFGHIQIADAPGRGAPGTGELPLEAWIDRSRELGYTGPIALEYKQETETAFDWLDAAPVDVAR